jgi:succinoglycan biosynthesis protein ExoV
VKLLYCKMDAGNFGDDLNEWFWDRAAPGALDGVGPDTLFGIGTLLQDYYARQLPEQGRVLVVGAGAGAKGPLPKVDDRWNFIGVRGPLTASYFDLPPEAVCGDPAILISKFEDLMDPARAGCGVGFMPHVWSLEDWDWEETCKRLGLVYVDPTADSKATIRLISGLDKLVTEAMHGAIVADAMRVPWIAVHLSDRFESTKWSDWAGSLGIDLHFRRLPQLRRRNFKMSQRLLNVAKELALRVGKNVNHIQVPGSSATEVAHSERTLRELARNMDGQLSDSSRLRTLVKKLENALEVLSDLSASEVR